VVRTFDKIGPDKRNLTKKASCASWRKGKGKTGPSPNSARKRGDAFFFVAGAAGESKKNTNKRRKKITNTNLWLARTKYYVEGFEKRCRSLFREKIKIGAAHRFFHWFRAAHDTTRKLVVVLRRARLAAGLGRTAPRLLCRGGRDETRDSFCGNIKDPEARIPAGSNRPSPSRKYGRQKNGQTKKGFWKKIWEEFGASPEKKGPPIQKKKGTRIINHHQGKKRGRPPSQGNLRHLEDPSRLGAALTGLCEDRREIRRQDRAWR